MTNVCHLPNKLQEIAALCIFEDRGLKYVILKIKVTEDLRVLQ